MIAEVHLDRDFEKVADAGHRPQKIGQPGAQVTRPVAERFAFNLKRCRKRVGLTQEELGDAAKLHRTEISLLETGGRIPRIDTLVKLAGGLGVEPSELLDGITWSAGPSEGS